jgi:ribonuclease HI
MTDGIYRIFSDGGARGNPGPAASAFVIYDGDDLVGESSKYLGSSSNNTAEYFAVVMALTQFINKGFNKNSKGIRFYLDSLLIVKQLTGEYKIKSPHLKILAMKIKELEKKISSEIKYIHITREKNKIADALVNKCLDENS